MFFASDIAKCLGCVNPRKAINDHCKGITKRSALTDSGMQEVKIIPEGDVYRLIIKSHLPAAEKFECWIFEEVLPSIRNSGGYGNIDIYGIVREVTTGVIKQIIPLLADDKRLKKNTHDYSGTNAKRKGRKNYIFHYI